MTLQAVEELPRLDSDLLRIGSLLEGDLPELTEAEWKRVGRRAIEERLGPLLSTRARVRYAIPESISDELRSAYYNTSGLNLLIYRELSRLLSLSAERSLEAPILLKGAALASALYEDIALRPMCDLDLLVPRDQLQDYVYVAGALGYRLISPEMAPGLSKATHFQVALIGGPSDTVMIELHWSLVGGANDHRAPDLSWFFEQTETWSLPRELGDTPCPPALQLGPTALLLYLSAHAVLQHGTTSARAIWFYDLHRIVGERCDDIQWDVVVAKARTFHWSGAVLRALERTRELFTTSLPSDVLLTLSKDSESEERNVSHLRVKENPRGKAELVWAEMACLQPVRRFQLALAILFPLPAYLRWRYPAARHIWPLCYPYRWSVVLLEAARALWRSLSLRWIDSRSTSC